MSLNHLPEFKGHGNKLPHPLSLLPLQKNVSPVDLPYPQTLGVFKKRQKFLVGRSIYLLGWGETAQWSDGVIESNGLSFKPFYKIFHSLPSSNQTKVDRFHDNRSDATWHHIPEEFLY